MADRATEEGRTMTAATRLLSLPIEGMTCASCVAHVEQALTELPGVSEIVVNLATNKAKLIYDPRIVGLPKIIVTVAGVGYQVPAAELTLDVQGMTCASCVGHVEGALNELPGVTGTAVNLGLGTAHVTYIPGIVTSTAMKQAVRSVGYEASEPSATIDALDRERQAREEETRRQGRNLLVAGIIGLLVMIGTFYDMLGPFQAVVPVWLSYKC
jgi:Cu+-exporting ATPase